MSYPSQLPDRSDDRPDAATLANVGLLSDILGNISYCPPRVARLIAAGAWTDAALALIELELPQWRLRRLAYDDGEWHCALSRQRELPDWLVDSIETRHADLAPAILSAIVEARRESMQAVRGSVPAVRSPAHPAYEPVCCDNFG